MRPAGRDWAGIGIRLGLVLAVLLIYLQVRGFEFSNFDDGDYVYANAHVIRGLSWQNLGWALTTGFAANWHPLTWLSHMADVSLFGVNSGPHHLVNVALHALNAVLLFQAFRTLTKEVWPSALVAALFAMHPLHVESVAWVAERKDVLSTALGFLSLWAYALNAHRPSRRLQALALGAFALGLTAKPMLVSLPLLLLLVDFWPLNRFTGWEAVRRILVEKIPYLALAALSCGVTFLAQRTGGAMVSISRAPFPLRLGNAILAYARYLKLTFLPHPLAPLYPFNGQDIHLGRSLLLACAGILLTALFLGLRRSRPYLLTGWLWFLVSLVPVIGLVQVGSQAMADRYTYLPLTGLFLMLAWGSRDLVQAWRVPRPLVGVLAGAALAVLGILAYVQVSYWRNPITLWGHALQAALPNVMARTNLADGLYHHGRFAEAAEAYRASDLAFPGHWENAYGLGISLRALGRREEALGAFRAALARDPQDVDSLHQVSEMLLESGDLPGLVPCLEALIRLEPVRMRKDSDPRRQFRVSQDLRLRLGFVLRKLGRDAEAAPVFAEAFRLDPRDLNAGFNLALSLEATGRREEAQKVLGGCQALSPGSPLIQRALDRVRNSGMVRASSARP